MSNGSDAAKAAHPFAALLGVAAPARLPITCSVQLVMDGKRVDRMTRAKAVGDDAATKLRKVQKAVHYQKLRQDPEAMAKRQARAEANAERMREYQRVYRETHREHLNKLKRDSVRRSFLRDPEAYRAKSREYYAANREKVLARMKARRDEAKAQKQAAQEAAAAAPGATAAAAPAPAAAAQPQAPDTPRRPAHPGQSGSSQAVPRSFLPPHHHNPHPWKGK
jgi:hypothetical protein